MNVLKWSNFDEFLIKKGFSEIFFVLSFSLNEFLNFLKYSNKCSSFEKKKVMVMFFYINKEKKIVKMFLPQ